MELPGERARGRRGGAVAESDQEYRAGGDDEAEYQESIGVQETDPRRGRTGPRGRSSRIHRRIAPPSHPTDPDKSLPRSSPRTLSPLHRLFRPRYRSPPRFRTHDQAIDATAEPLRSSWCSSSRRNGPPWRTNPESRRTNGRMGRQRARECQQEWWTDRTRERESWEGRTTDRERVVLKFISSQFASKITQSSFLCSCNVLDRVQSAQDEN